MVLANNEGTYTFLAFGEKGPACGARNRNISSVVYFQDWSLFQLHMTLG